MFQFIIFPNLRNFFREVGLLSTTFCGVCFQARFIRGPTKHRKGLKHRKGRQRTMY